MYILKIIILRFVEALGVVLSVKELWDIIFSDVKWANWVKIAILLLLPLFFAFAHTCYKLFCSVYSIENTDSKISLSFGNILNQKGVVVVHVNREFDTIVGNGVVDPESLHGRFINKYYKNELTTLDSIIDAELLRQKIPFDVRNDKEKGKRKTYPLGTCVQIEKDGKKFILAALTKFDSQCHAEPISKYTRNEFLPKVWEWIRNNIEPNVVHFAVIGTGCSRMVGTTLEKYRAVVDSGLVAISESKLYQTFDITLPMTRDAFSNYKDFNEYIRFRAVYKEMSNPELDGIGTGV